MILFILYKADEAAWHCDPKQKRREYNNCLSSMSANSELCCLLSSYLQLYSGDVS